MLTTAHIPLLPPEEVPTSVAPLVDFLGALPNSMRAYAHRPEIMEAFVALEMALLPTGEVATLLKARVGYLVSRLNGCDYCASHVGARLQRNGVDEGAIACVIQPVVDTGDAATDSALRFARNATLGQPTANEVADMARYFTPPQIVEIACVVGFFCWTNRVHDALGLPIEPGFQAIGAHRIAVEGVVR